MGRQLKAALLTASTRSDVKRSGGMISITDLQSFAVGDILSVERRKSTDEVAQVYTIGGTTAPVITASTRYTVRIGYVYNGGSNGEEQSPVPFSFTSAVTLSGTAATDRQNVYDALTSRINASNLPVTASAGTGGTGMTISDDGGYFAGRPATPKGRSYVALVPDTATGTGFINNTELELTTASVYAFGDGTELAAAAAVADKVTGNLIQGEWLAPDGAVGGQKYDGFFFSTSKRVNHEAVKGLSALATDRQLVYVDNGNGSDTTNATGFAATLREIERIIYVEVYGQDPSSLVSLIEDKPLFSGTLGAISGARDAENVIAFSDGKFSHRVLGTQTIIAPNWTTDGLDLVQDTTDGDGSELSAPIESVSPQQFIVGQTEFSLRASYSVVDITDLNPFNVGFRKKEAYQRDFNSYDEMASLATNSIDGATKSIYISNILNNAGTAFYDTNVEWADGESKDFEIRVALDGTVSYLVDDVDVTSVQSSVMVFDAGEVVIPFGYQLSEGGDSGLTLEKFFSIPAILDINA